MTNNGNEIIKRFSQVAITVKDDTQRAIVNAVRSKKITLDAKSLQLVLQVIDASITTTWGNSERILKKTIDEQLDVVFGDGFAAGSKKS